MSEFDTNYSGLYCPFCNDRISYHSPPGELWVDDLGDKDYDFFQCNNCEKFFKVELNIYKEYNYIISKPTKEEIEEHKLRIDGNKDNIEDCPGQELFWEDLFSNKS